MKPLFEHRPAVGGKLSSQDPGRFVMLQDGDAMDLARTPSLLRTEQIPEAELMALAARTKGAAEHAVSVGSIVPANGGMLARSQEVATSRLAEARWSP